jgi:hypothetical protein
MACTEARLKRIWAAVGQVVLAQETEPGAELCHNGPQHRQTLEEDKRLRMVRSLLLSMELQHCI